MLSSALWVQLWHYSALHDSWQHSDQWHDIMTCVISDMLSSHCALQWPIIAVLVTRVRFTTGQCRTMFKHELDVKLGHFNPVKVTADNKSYTCLRLWESCKMCSSCTKRCLSQLELEPWHLCSNLEHLPLDYWDEPGDHSWAGSEWDDDWPWPWWQCGAPGKVSPECPH